MIRYSAYYAVILLFFVFAALSYFGAPNPSLMGMQSSIGACALAAAACLAMGAVSGPAFRVAIILLWLLYLTLTVGAWWYFQYFRAFFSYEILSLGLDGLEAVRSIEAFEYTEQALFLAILSGALLLVALAGHDLSVYRRKSASGVVICLALLSLFMFHNTSQVNTALKRQNKFFLSPLSFHPVHAFFTSLDHSGDMEENLRSWEYFSARNQGVSGDRDFAGNATERLNVLVITMESFRAAEIGYYAGGDLTPNFDALARDNWTARNFYSNSNLTVKAETSIHCGVFDHNVKLSYAEYRNEKSLRCLPHILQEHGYSTWYFHGNKGKFYNRTDYLPQLGFSNLYFHADQPQSSADGRTYLGWGLSDLDMFDIALAKLEVSTQPFYATIMTLTNHYPFDHGIPSSGAHDQEYAGEGLTSRRIFALYKESIRYSDHALGQFWADFEQSELAKNTIVVITADHGIWSFADTYAQASYARKNEAFFRMPLVIYDPRRRVPRHTDAVASQIDIAPTLLDLLGIRDDRVSLVGKNMFKAVKEPWAVMAKTGELFVRTDESLCFYESSGCGGAQQNCFSELAAVNVAKASPVCTLAPIAQDDDVTSTESDAENLVDKAYGMVAFENFRAFVQPESTLLGTPPSS